MDMAERHGRILGRLSELGLALAEAAQERALCAETTPEVRDLTLAFHRAARSVRQTLALEAKLERDRRRQDREDDALAVRRARDAAQTRKARVRLAVERLVWTEADEDEAENLLADLDDRLEEAAYGDDFADQPIEALIERIAADLGLTLTPLIPAKAGTQMADFETGSKSAELFHHPPASQAGSRPSPG